MQRLAVFPCFVLACLALGVPSAENGALALEPSSVPYVELLPGAPPVPAPALLFVPDPARAVELPPPAPREDRAKTPAGKSVPLPPALPDKHPAAAADDTPSAKTQVAQQVEPVQPAQPAQPSQPAQQPTTQPATPEQPSPTSTEAGGGSLLAGLLPSVGGGGAASLPAAAPATQVNAATAAPAANVVTGGDQAQTVASSDAGDLLAKSQQSVGVDVQHRSPVVSYPIIRGYYDGQLTVLANGAPFYPARYDLDTVVSKIDSSNIDSVVVIKGPYSVRYGPGFAFLDIETLGTPRYDSFQAHESTSVVYQTNGEQWRGRQAFWGGESDWGFRLGYDILQGADYVTGGGLTMPSSYHQQDIDFAYGLDLSPEAHLEFKGLRLRQRNVELPGTLTDISALVTDAYTLRFTVDQQPFFDHMQFDAWYNYTHFNGNDLSPKKKLQIPELNNFFNGVPDTQLLLETQGDSISRGFREAITWGQAKKPQFTVGVDLEYLSSYLDELDTFVNMSAFVPPGTAINTGNTFNSPIPRAHLSDPGLFMDTVLPANDHMIFKAGVRVDFVEEQVEKLKNLPNVPQITPDSYMTDLGSPNALSERHFYLWTTYMTGDYKLDENWKLLGGCAFAQIPPTLTQLYADTPFLGLVQNGFNYFLGNPDLSAPQAIQVDLGLKADYERFRTGLSFYYSWIHNYITYELFDPGATLLASQGRPVPLNGYRFVNTDLATLGGGEYYAEWDVLDWLTPFGTLSDTEGRDLTRNGRDNTYFSVVQFPYVTRGGVGNQLRGSAQEPLPGILPIEAHVGFRLHQPGKNPRWGIEFYAWIVGDQNRVAESLLEKPIPGFAIYNIRAYWQVNKNFLLTAGVENLTDKNYRESVDLLTGRGVFQPGINFYFGSKLQF